jgi:O-antigen/teichoic acid export membrane protein
MNKLVRNSIFYSLGNFTSVALNFILLPLYTRSLSPSEFGIVNSMQVFSSILMIFFTLGLERSIYRLFFDFNTDEEKKDFLGTVTVSILVISLVLCGFLFIFNHVVERIYKSIPFFPYFSIAIITAFFMTFELVPTISLQVKQKAKQYLIVSLLLLVFRIVPVIWLVVILKEGAVGMLKGSLIGNFLSLLMLVPITLSQINIKFNFSILNTTFKYCLPLIPMVMSSWVVNMSDRIFIEQYFSISDVGIYSLGYKIGQLVQLVSVALLMAYTPYFYKLANSDKQQESKQKIYKINNISIVIQLFIGLCVAVFSKDIILLFFDQKYAETYKIIPVVVFGYFFIQLISMQNLSFYQEKKTKEIMVINIVGAVINIFLNFLFISRFGYMGAAVSTFATQLILFIIIYHFSKNYYFVPYNWSLIVPLLIISTLIVVINNVLIPVTLLFFLLKILFGLIILIGLLYYSKNDIMSLINSTNNATH